MNILKRMISLFASDEQEYQPGNLGRNDDCWCGSGRKYKKCHLEADEKKLSSRGMVRCGRT